MKNIGKSFKILCGIVFTIAILSFPIVSNAVTLTNPTIKKYPYADAGQNVTYQAIYFGSYPQAEIIPTTSTYKAIPSKSLRPGDLIVDSSLYNLLSKSNWGDKYEIVVNGVKYTRAKSTDSWNPTKKGYEYFYNWDDNVYHYFKNEPIKWRVLSVNGNEAFLLADKILDISVYNFKAEDGNAWGQSIVRSWLNGYDASNNLSGYDFKTEYINFIDTAFTATQAGSIITSSIDGKKDKLFILAQNDISGSAALKYGFISSYQAYDEARCALVSTYAKAMGTFFSNDEYFEGLGHWYTRTPGNTTDTVIKACYDGDCGTSIPVNHAYFGIRPAMRLDLSRGGWTYAGTVNSVDVINKKTTVINATDMAVALNKTGAVIPATLSSGAKPTFTSSNPSVALVSSTGLITPKGVGETVITINAPDTLQYKPASKTIKLTVNPKKIKIKTVKSKAKKKAEIVWVKDTTISGYQLNLSLKPNFASGVISRKYGKTTTKKVISNLKQKKKYYVRIRTYKKVGGKNYYSDWSTVKIVKIR